jgi:hypothetical protein
MKRDLTIGFISILIFSAGIYCGATIKTSHAERDRQTAIKNAIAHCETPVDCQTQEITDTLMRMAENGFEVDRYGLCWASSVDAIPEGP